MKSYLKYSISISGLEIDKFKYLSRSELWLYPNSGQIFLDLKLKHNQGHREVHFFKIWYTSESPMGIF